MVRIENESVTIKTSVIFRVRRRDEQIYVAISEFLTHVSDGVVEHASSVVCTFTDQFDLGNKNS